MVTLSRRERGALGSPDYHPSPGLSLASGAPNLPSPEPIRGHVHLIEGEDQTQENRKPMAKILHVEKDNWQEVLSSSQPLLVDFWAGWCGPCRALAPTIEKLAEKYGNEVRFAKLDVDELPEVASQFGIQSIPTLLLFEGGEVVAQLVGLQPYQKLAGLLDRYTSPVARN
jgi:thioredoxin 1